MSGNMKKALIALVLAAAVLAAGMTLNAEPGSGDGSEDTSEEIILAETDNEIPDDYDDTLLDELRARYPNPTLVMGDAEAKAGDEVTIQTVVVNNPGILGMAATLSYNEDVMTLEDAQTGEAVEEVLDFTSSGTLGDSCRFLWDGVDITSDQVKDGAVLQLTFKISDTAESGRYPVALLLDSGSTVDSDLNEIDMTVDCGYITVD